LKAKATILGPQARGGGTENAGVENAGVEISARNSKKRQGVENAGVKNAGGNLVNIAHKRINFFLNNYTLINCKSHHTSSSKHQDRK